MHGKTRRPGIQGRVRYGDCAVAVRIGFDYCDNLNLFAYMLFESAHVRRNGIQVDFCPGNNSC
jgi:hypothetical protein